LKVAEEIYLMGLPKPGRFDPDKHEKFVQERFAEEARRRARYDAFDALVDMALDGQITLQEAITEFELDEKESQQ